MNAERTGLLFMVVAPTVLALYGLWAALAPRNSRPEKRLGLGFTIGGVAFSVALLTLTPVSPLYVEFMTSRPAMTILNALALTSLLLIGLYWKPASRAIARKNYPNNDA